MVEMVYKCSVFTGHTYQMKTNNVLILTYDVILYKINFNQNISVGTAMRWGGGLKQLKAVKDMVFNQM